MDEYLTPKEAAQEIGIKYPALLARIRTGKIMATKRGWALFIHRDEIKRVKDAYYKDLEGPAR